MQNRRHFKKESTFNEWTFIEIGNKYWITYIQKSYLICSFTIPFKCKNKMNNGKKKKKPQMKKNI